MQNIVLESCVLKPVASNSLSLSNAQQNAQVFSNLFGKYSWYDPILSHFRNSNNKYVAAQTQQMKDRNPKPQQKEIQKKPESLHSTSRGVSLLPLLCRWLSFKLLEISSIRSTTNALFTAEIPPHHPSATRCHPPCYLQPPCDVNSSIKGYML